MTNDKTKKLAYSGIKIGVEYYVKSYQIFYQFVSELARVAAPGATIIIVTWCHRNLAPSEDSLKPDELNLLKKICDAYYLPDWCSPSDYVKIAESLSLEVISPQNLNLFDLPDTQICMISQNIHVLSGYQNGGLV